MASPRFDPNWTRLPAGTEIPQLRTSTSHTYSNGDGTFTADVAPSRTDGADSQDSCQPTSSGWIYYFYDQHSGDHYYRYGPEMRFRDGNWYGAAYAKFDLAPIPDSSTVMSVQWCFFQYAYTYPETAMVMYTNLDPDSASNIDLLSAIRFSGVLLAEGRYSYTGWVTQELSVQGVHIVQNRLQEDWITLGIKPGNDLDGGGGEAYGMRSDSLQTYLHIVYIAPDEADIQAVRAELLTWPVIAGTSDTSLLVLTNKGLHTSDSFWAYATSQGLALESTLVGNIAVGETVSVRLPIPLPYGGKAFVDYALWSACLSDPWPANDTTAFTCWVFPRGTYMVESFEQSSFPPPGWAIVDNDTGRQCWERRAGDGLQHSGDAYAFSQRENGWGFNDDWLVTGPVYPRADHKDSVGVCYRSHEYPTLLNLQLWVLDGQTIDDTIIRLAQVDVTDTAYRWRTVSLDGFDGDAIYIGFRNTSGGGQTFEGLCLDDIWLSRIYVPGTYEPQASLARKRELTLVPNPTTGRFVTVRYDIAAGARGKLTLRDVLGGMVKSFTLDPSGRTRLDLRGLGPGVYIAMLEASGQSIRRKLVITAR